MVGRMFFAMFLDNICDLGKKRAYYSLVKVVYIFEFEQILKLHNNKN